MSLVAVSVAYGSPSSPPASSSVKWPGSYYTGPAGRNNILPRRQGVLVGIWDNRSDTVKLKTRESQVGRLFDIAAVSSGENYPIRVGKLKRIRNEGRIPLLTMNSRRTVAEINAGAEDAWHVRAARAVRELRVPTFVKIYHEFNGNWMSYYTPGDTPADGQAFIQAWHRIVTTFKNQGAGNAVFVWHPHGPAGANAQVRYPGDAWVDWIGNSSYTYAPQQWVGFYQDYADVWQLLGWAREYKVSIPDRYNDIRYKPFVDSFNKPFMIAELGHFGDSRKAQWFRSAKANLLGTFEPSKQNGGFPNVHALIYSDYGKEVGPNAEDWTIDNESGLDGFRDMVRDPFFNTRGLSAPADRG